MIDDVYIRAAMQESISIPDKQKQRIIERFTTKQMTFDGRRYHCPHCRMPTPKVSNYCCICGQKVTFEKPVMAVLD